MVFTLKKTFYKSYCRSATRNEIITNHKQAALSHYHTTTTPPLAPAHPRPYVSHWWGRMLSTALCAGRTQHPHQPCWLALPSARAGHAHTTVAAPSLPLVSSRNKEREREMGGKGGREDDGEIQKFTMGLCKEIRRRGIQFLDGVSWWYGRSYIETIFIVAGWDCPEDTNSDKLII